MIRSLEHYPPAACKLEEHSNKNVSCQFLIEA